MHRAMTFAANVISILLALLGIGTLIVLSLSGDVIPGAIGASLYFAVAILVAQLTRIHKIVATQTELLELMLEQLKRSRQQPRGDA